MENKGKLRRLILKGYKSIKAIDFEFRDLNILIGANGAGKSNFINFFNFMRKIVEKESQITVAQMGGANKVLHFGRKTTKEIEINLQFTPNEYHAILIPDQQDKLIFKEERYSYYIKGSKINYDLYNVGGYESKLPDKFSYEPKGYVIKYIKDWKVYHFHDTGENSPMKQPSRTYDYYSLSVDGHNIAAYLYFLKNNHNQIYKEIVKTVQRVAPFFHDFILEPDPANKEMIKLRWKHKGSDMYFDVNDLSDGTIRFICLVTLLLQPHMPTSILIDEPELGLHPFALKILAGLLKIASAKTQIIVSTQSLPLVELFDVEDIVVADMSNNSTTLKRLDREDLKDWLDSYTIGELWEKNVLGGIPKYD
jgi:predicted ATPase